MRKLSDIRAALARFYYDERGGLFLPPTPRLTPPDASTSLWYPLNDAASPAVNSGQAGALNLTAGGNVAFAQTGLFDKCVYISKTGGTGDRLESADTSVGETSGVCSFSCWVNCRAYVNFATIFQKQYRAGGTWTAPFWSIVLQLHNTGDGEWGSGVTNGGANFATTNGGTNNRQYSVQLNVWTLLSGTFDKNNFNAYFNGSLCGGPLAVGTNVSVDWGTHGGWDVGGNSKSVGDQFRGFIEDVRFETVVRSQAYYQQMYQYGLGLFNP